MNPQQLKCALLALVCLSAGLAGSLSAATEEGLPAAHPMTGASGWQDPSLALSSRLRAARLAVGSADGVQLAQLAVEGIKLDHKVTDREFGIRGDPEDINAAVEEGMDCLGAAYDLLSDLAEKDQRSVIPLLIEVTKQRDKSLASDAAEYLARYKPPPAEALPILRQRLNDRDDGVRSRAAGSLRHLSDDALPAVPRMIELLADRNEEVRQNAARFFGGLRPSDAQVALPALIQAFETSKKSETRGQCVAALGSLGPLAQGAVPALRKELSNPRKGDEIEMHTLSGEIKSALWSIEPH